MSAKHFQFSFESSKQPGEIFQYLINPQNWWMGLFGEEIKGENKKPGDEFTFKAGDGVHYSKQKMLELIPDKKIVWLVTESKLSFLQNESEWTGTRFGFDIGQQNGKSKITFSHFGLTNEIECFDQCSSAWMQYMHKLKTKMQ